MLAFYAVPELSKYSVRKCGHVFEAPDFQCFIPIL